MNIHLHHAISHASAAISNLSHAAMWESSPELRQQGVGYARDYLAKAAAELNAYDAKMNAEKLP